MAFVQVSGKSTWHGYGMHSSNQPKQTLRPIAPKTVRCTNCGQFFDGLVIGDCPTNNRHNLVAYKWPKPLSASNNKAINRAISALSAKGIVK
jgi:hypothetical protein